MTVPRRAGIISAGNGERLRTAYPETIKPMVPVRGRPMIHWIVSSLRAAGVREIVCLLNSRGEPARRYLEARFGDIAWTFRAEDTASSWESFRLVSRALARGADPFLVSTVDALIPAPDVSRFAEEALRGLRGGAAAALALTRFVEDEKPLWADRAPDGQVTAVGPDARRREFVTCGLYALSSAAARALPPEGAHARLRDFWTAAVRGEAPVLGVPVGRSVDLDRPEDLAAAESLLASAGAAA